MESASVRRTLSVRFITFHNTLPTEFYCTFYHLRLLSEQQVFLSVYQSDERSCSLPAARDKGLPYGVEDCEAPQFLTGGVSYGQKR